MLFRSLEVAAKLLFADVVDEAELLLFIKLLGVVTAATTAEEIGRASCRERV